MADHTIVNPRAVEDTAEMLADFRPADADAVG
jgi:hypothetical protein